MTVATLRAFARLLAVSLLCLPMLTGCLSFHRGALPGEPADASFVQLEGARVRYLDEGPRDGEPVVLIHGFASSLDAWRSVLPVLTPHRRVVAIDLKGFGWSDRPEGDYSPRAQADLVAQLLDHLGIERTAVVAHSWGSSVALAFALAQPERVDRIVLYDAWVYEDQLPTTFLWARADGIGELLFGMFYDQLPEDKVALAFYDDANISEALVETIHEQLARPGTTAAALAAVRGQRFAEMETHYREIDKPVLLLWGRDDDVTQLRFGERLSLELPHARLITYPQCGHFPMIEAVHASNRDLVAFLDSAIATETAPPAPAPPKPAAPKPAATPTPPTQPRESDDDGGDSDVAPDVDADAADL